MLNNKTKFQSYFDWKDEMKKMQKNYYASVDKMKFKNKIRIKNNSKRRNWEKLMRVLFV